MSYGGAFLVSRATEHANGVVENVPSEEPRSEGSHGLVEHFVSHALGHDVWTPVKEVVDDCSFTIRARRAEDVPENHRNAGEVSQEATRDLHGEGWLSSKRDVSVVVECSNDFPLLPVDVAED